MAEEVGSRFQVRGSLRAPALPEKPSFCPGFVSAVAAPASSCCLGRREGKVARSPSSKPRMVETCCEALLTPPEPLPPRLSSCGPPASHIPRRCPPQLLRDAASHPTGLGSLRGPLCPSGPGGWPPGGDSARHPRASDLQLKRVDIVMERVREDFSNRGALLRGSCPWRWAEGSADGGAARKGAQGFAYLGGLCLGSWPGHFTQRTENSCTRAHSGPSL